MVVSITHWRPLDLLSRNKKQMACHLFESYSIFILLHEYRVRPKQVRPSKIKSRFHYRAQKYSYKLQLDLDFIFVVISVVLTYCGTQNRTSSLTRYKYSHTTSWPQSQVLPPITKRKNPNINIQASWSALQAHLHLGRSRRSLMEQLEQQPCRLLKGS